MKISINLLPAEIILLEKQQSKLFYIKGISAITLFLIILITVGVFSLNLLQSSNLKQTNAQVNLASEKVTSLKEKESYIYVMKQRLSSIQNLFGGDTKKIAIFNTITALIPPNIKVTQISVDKQNNVAVSLNSNSLEDVDLFIQNLASKEKTSDLVAKVEMEGITRGRDNSFRMNLKIIPK